MTKLFGTLALSAVTAVLAPQALKAQGPTNCPAGNAIMNGAYVATGTGTVAGVGPITIVGLVVYNGDGTASIVSGTQTVNGVAAALSNVPGTFTVNKDCTGVKVFGSGSSATHMNFVVAPDGSTIYWTVTDNGVTFSGTGVRIGRSQ